MILIATAAIAASFGFAVTAATTDLSWLYLPLAGSAGGLAAALWVALAPSLPGRDAEGGPRPLLRRIGQDLKAVYAGTLTAPLPDRIARLAAELDRPVPGRTA